VTVSASAEPLYATAALARYPVRANSLNGAGATVARIATCRCCSTAGFAEFGSSPQSTVTSVPGTACSTSIVARERKAESVAMTFMVCAGMFGGLALYGTTTSRSLAGWGQFLFMGLIGVVLASIVGMFWHNDALQFLISIVGVIVFTGLTAWDAQRLKQMALALPEGQVGSYAVVGALSLYLDFINLFLMLLRLTGGRRE